MSGIERARWLAERRAATMAAYDAGSARYDAEEYPSEVQREWVGRLVRGLPPGSMVLDAPCGTGKYFALVTEAGHRVAGVDQSSGMLSQARARGLAAWLEQCSLQDLAFEHQFEAVLTIDAMEHIPPDDWPLVLANLHRAVRPGGWLYLTVEEADASRIEDGFAAMSEAGLPAVHGEVIAGDVGGYHYYPSRLQVLEWFAAEGLEVVEETFQQQTGWGYRHFLLRDQPRSEQTSSV